MQNSKANARKQRGQAIVLVALMAVALVAFVGLALDGAQLFENRRWMQNGADSGALAGATELGGGAARAAIAAKISAYTVGAGGIGNNADAWEAVYLPSGNNVKTQEPNYTGPTPDECVRVTSYVTFPTYFVGVIGFDQLNTSAQATACSGYTVQSYGGGLRPLAIALTTEYKLNVDYCLFDSTPQNTPPDCTGAGLNGQFGWVQMQLNDGINEISNNLVNGFSGNYHYWTGSDCLGGPADAPILPTPSCLALRTGVGGGTKDELTSLWISGTEFVVPIWDYQKDISGSESRIHIVAFAKFRITKVDMTGNPKYIKGRWISFVNFGEICQPGTPGCYVTQFTKKAVQLYR